MALRKITLIEKQIGILEEARDKIDRAIADLRATLPDQPERKDEPVEVTFGDKTFII